MSQNNTYVIKDRLEHAKNI